MWLYYLFDSLCLQSHFSPDDTGTDYEQHQHYDGFALITPNV